MKTYKLIVLILALSILLSALPVHADNISPIRPVSEKFFEWLCTNEQGNPRTIPFVVTYANQSNYRADWTPPSAAQCKSVYIWNSAWGPHIRLQTRNAVVLNGHRYGGEDIMGVFNVDGTIPDTDPEFWTLYNKWVVRNEIDLYDILKDRQFAAKWVQFLVMHGWSSRDSVTKFKRELELLGLDPRTGLPHEYDMMDESYNQDMEWWHIGLQSDIMKPVKNYYVPDGYMEQEEYDVDTWQTFDDSLFDMSLPNMIPLIALMIIVTLGVVKSISIKNKEEVKTYVH